MDFRLEPPLPETRAFDTMSTVELGTLLVAMTDELISVLAELRANVAGPDSKVLSERSQLLYKCRTLLYEELNQRLLSSRWNEASSRRRIPPSGTTWPACSSANVAHQQLPGGASFSDNTESFTGSQ